MVENKEKKKVECFHCDLIRKHNKGRIKICKICGHVYVFTLTKECPCKYEEIIKEEGVVKNGRKNKRNKNKNNRKLH